MKKYFILLSLIYAFNLFAGDKDINLDKDYYLRILEQYVGDEKGKIEKQFQRFFDDTSSQLGFGMSYHAASPAQNLKFGILPTLDAGLDISVLQIDTSDEMWSYVIKDEDVPAVFAIPRLHLNMGLPADLEIGMSFSMVPSTNIYLIGGEIKWSMIGTYDSFFNLAIRFAATKLVGVEQLSLQSFETNISTSFDFKILLPYIGGGIVNIISEAEVPVFDYSMLEDTGLTASQQEEIKAMFPDNEPFVKLKKYNHVLPKFYGGFKFDLWLINFDAEVAFSYDFSEKEYINTLYTLRANLSF